MRKNYHGNSSHRDGTMAEHSAGTGYKITFEVQGRLVLKRVNVITFGHPTVQQAGVAAPKKIWEPPDMSLLHYFLNDQLSLSDSVLS